MSRFDDYSGLFADRGDFDIPAALQAGLGWDFNNGLTLGADWEYILYEGTGSISNSSAIPLLLGSPGGPGFGWSNINVYRIGAEYKQDNWAVRAGYSKNDNPISPADVYFNILAPGVVTDHVAVGGTYDINENSSISVAYSRSFSNSVSGFLPGPTPATIRMDQHEFTVGYTYKW